MQPALTREEADAAVETKTGQKVTKEYIESRIKRVEYMPHGRSSVYCFLTLDTGWVEEGKAGAVSPENFDIEIGKRYAYDAAFKKLWPLFGFALKEQLHGLNGLRSSLAAAGKLNTVFDSLADIASDKVVAQIDEAISQQRSRAMRSLNKAAQDLHGLGVITDDDMRACDAWCLKTSEIGLP